MLTFPSDSLPHLAFPMDGDAMIPHPFCSAPPHTEPQPPPPPPLLPLPSTTPRASDGTSGHGGSDRVQAGERQGAGVENEVQLCQSKQPRVENAYEDNKHMQDGCDFENAAEFQNTEKEFAEEPDKRLLERSDPTSASEALSHFADMSAAAPSRWLMGPLFNSFKSKIASFTEIVMSPTKLFKDKNLPAAELQPGENDESLGANRGTLENSRREENEGAFTLLLQPGSDSRHSLRLFSTSLDGVELPLPSSHQAQLLGEPTVNLADIVEDKKKSLGQKNRQRKPAVERVITLYSCNVQLERLQNPNANHVACRETNSGFAQSKRMLKTQGWEESKRQKLDTKNNVAKQPAHKKKATSAVSDGREEFKPDGKFRKVKRKAEGEEKSDDGGGRKAKHRTSDLGSNPAAAAEAVLPLGNATAKARKPKSLVPTLPSSFARRCAPAEVDAQSEGGPTARPGRAIKRPKKAPQGRLQAQTKKTEAKCGKAPMPGEPLYFEMTPFEGHQSECTEPNQNGHSGGGASMLRNRRGNRKEPRGDSQVRRSRFSGTHSHDWTASATAEDLPSPTVQSAPGGRLRRSSSCPEIPSLFASLPRQPPPASVSARVHRGRARRHTVGSLEIEREIAPLCLRKEVYPSRRSLLSDGQNLPPALSPNSSLSALASCFLSSPLAFLSGRGEDRAAAASHPVSGHAAQSSSSAPILMKTDTSCGALDACASTSLLAGETDGIAPSEDNDDDDSTSRGFDEAVAAALREEKSLSDSELKTVEKHEQRGKVSSIRIRRALPKPQNNLTPMGLPKAVRLKKKQFSLEEIYTNKNFCKPPESRLETVFEVPLSRRDGSESRFGQRRLKRFLEFLEAGEARKPKKVLGGGGGKAGAASSRTRRGGFAKDDSVASLLAPPDADSLLCAKLKQLDLWLIGDRADFPSVP
ncbi:uncharacterized protein prr14 isoform X2 [Syngnathoides biaculeatus]|uniref:uncharacterized protein prr14 isoform X2 n=1 Tax=Syngnathoides biaculeatus TaxID=300417 RepID=UPI002ADDCAB8|nr:uncharacterized protein prr14 isoform X2 [Syngnathoides biaculeatus]